MNQLLSVPDIGVAQATVLEICISIGSSLTPDTTICVLESDKASVEVPASCEGIVCDIHLTKGSIVRLGDPMITIAPASNSSNLPPQSSENHGIPPSSPSPSPSENLEHKTSTLISSSTPPSQQDSESGSPDSSASTCSSDDSVDLSSVHAGPGARRLARELGVHLHKVIGSGIRNRISISDIKRYVQEKMNAISSSTAPLSSMARSDHWLLQTADLPTVDHQQGPHTVQQESRVKKWTSIAMARNWLACPQVTQFEESDITDLEAFRKSQQASLQSEGVRLTLLSFVMKAVAHLLKQHPRFNSTWLSHGELMMKHYIHIGFAVDTPSGLVVPVIRDVDQKSLRDICVAISTLSEKARSGHLSPQDLKGGCFTISSLGGIGGTQFTPLVNVPEVAILGLSKSQIKPVWHESSHNFMPRLMLPLALSYDHRVIDGAEAARWMVQLSKQLSDIRQLLIDMR